MTPGSTSNPFEGDRPAELWLVIPAYRESRRIGPFLRELLPLLESEPMRTRVVVVDDGSGEPELQRLRAVLAPLLSGHPELLRLLELPGNRGKGGAVRAGWDACPAGDFLGFVDADGSIAAREVARLARMALGRRPNATSLFGSRVKMLGRKVERRGWRHVSGRAFATLVGLVTRVGVYDSQCGLKFVPASVYHAIRPVLREQGFAFDVELMMAILRSGNAIEEVPIDWREAAGGKVSFLKDPLKMLVALAAIQRRTSAWTFSKGES
jgi:dolichyl-phosphate beta-glucosyltransferase